MEANARTYAQASRLLAGLCLAAISMTMAHAAAKPTLMIKSAAYNKKTASLVVKTSVKNTSGLMSLIHSKGGVLGQTSDSEHTFSIPMAQVGDIPCQVEARLGEMKISKAVSGASAECSKVPTCKILPFAKNTRPLFNVPFTFEAQVTLKDKKAAPLTIEWDFAGGVMGHPYERLLKDGKAVTSGKVKTEATFIRDNSRYHVRFAAHDNLGRRCEAGTYVDIGTPPTDLPDPMALEDMVKSSQANAPQKGHALQQPEGAKIVLPYQDWTMQTATDARTLPSVYVVYGPQVNNINATVYQKARQPAVVEADQIELKYSAASNPADPVGPNSINSTSQNWPVGTTLMNASVQKSDYFETYTPPADAILGEGYYTYSFANFLTPYLASAVDEGYHNAYSKPPLNKDHGRYMPGIDNPYVANDPQPFSDYVADDNSFVARMLPLTDIDDKGRVNPFPLFRVEANEVGGNTIIAATDIVANSGRDLHCRECHAKGKIGANPNRPPFTGHIHGGTPLRKLNFVEPDSDSLFDQEYAAIKNIANLHLYGGTHEGTGVWGWMDNGINADGNATGGNGPLGCNNSNCHTTALAKTPYRQPLHGINQSKEGNSLSNDIHSMHGQMQYNANKDDIVRNDTGYLKRFDPAENWDPVTGSMPNSLFPVKDKNGKILPMEENCLKCHGGKREQCYRDRMYTAGVTCYQCHGDMLAVGNSFKKSKPGPDGNISREPWLDEPDCGSCHTGNANQGKAAVDGFFSAGVKKTAFDENDRSATPRQPDLANPDQSRFAVPITAMDIGSINYTADGGPAPIITKTRLFRAAKDNHGQVACAACHGAAHAIWPNRDPNANDNVTALQLQGHIGHISECSVCHTADAFAKFEDLDEGLKATDPQTNILGGPHNMHPVNDPNWWKEAVGDTVDSTPNAPNRKGAIKGGWHNDYAKLPGIAGEDQCAACHGNDHLGTRLSKTPVDREFITENGKTIKVKAGTEIGCNLCHSVAKSCTQSPSFSDCGKPSEHVSGTTNLPPVITSQPVVIATIGEDYRYAVEATDPEQGDLSYQLTLDKPQEINIDAHTGVITMSANSVLGHLGSYNLTPPTVLFDYQVIVRDSKGAQTVQSVTVNADCPAGKIWDGTYHRCVDVLITSKPSIDGLNADQAYSYQVIAKQRSGEALKYSLSNQPLEMSIDASTGLITWPKAQGNTQGQIYFTVTASNNQGGSAQQKVYLSVCASPLHWDQNSKTCQGPIAFTSSPTIQIINTGETYTYPVTATQVDNLPLSFSLSNAPQNMTIDSNTGLINWLVQASVSGNVGFVVNASDSKGGLANQGINVLVCAAPEYSGPSPDGNTMDVCLSPIQFTSIPPYGVNAGQAYNYQVTATHANGLAMTYSLAPMEGMPMPVDMTIDAQSGLISWIGQTQPDNGGYASFIVVATDSNGYSTSQSVQILVCDSPTSWDESWGMCRGPVIITSTQPVQGLDVGQTFSYQVTATDNDPNGLPITYTLSDATVPGATIDPNTGLITWVAEDMSSYGSFMYLNITAADQQGRQEQQPVSINVCVLPDHWDAVNGYCTR